MNWATTAIEKLRQGEVATLYPRGFSMRPLIDSGECVVVVPLGDTPLHRGDIVLATVKGTVYLHKVLAVQGDRVLIGNNHGGVNGWTSRAKVHGVAVEVGG